MSGDKGAVCSPAAFPRVEVKLVRKGTPEREQAILDDVEILERD
ncbi:hypothetical protein [Rhizobium laguerreae]|nr:hypothetical protein [Rhizobium laguerreae]